LFIKHVDALTADEIASHVSFLDTPLDLSWDNIETSALCDGDIENLVSNAAIRLKEKQRARSKRKYKRFSVPNYVITPRNLYFCLPEGCISCSVTGKGHYNPLDYIQLDAILDSVHSYQIESDENIRTVRSSTTRRLPRHCANVSSKGTSAHVKKRQPYR
jgi:hypothetical protein